LKPPAATDDLTVNTAPDDRCPSQDHEDDAHRDRHQNS